MSYNFYESIYFIHFLKKIIKINFWILAYGYFGGLPQWWSDLFFGFWISLTYEYQISTFMVYLRESFRYSRSQREKKTISESCTISLCLNWVSNSISLKQTIIEFLQIGKNDQYLLWSMLYASHCPYRSCSRCFWF